MHHGRLDKDTFGSSRFRQGRHSKYRPANRRERGNLHKIRSTWDV